MNSLIEIEKEIIDCKDQGDRFLTKQEVIDGVLDEINEVTKLINLMNDCYLQIFNSLEKMSHLEASNEEEISSVKAIINFLGEFTTRSSIHFAKLTHIDIFRTGCKTALSDWRGNIRAMREYLEDIEESFFLSDPENSDEFDLQELI